MRSFSREAYPSIPLQPVQPIFDTIQRARRGAERGTRQPARAVTLRAWSTASTSACRVSRRYGALLTQSVAPLGAPPTE